MSSKISKNYLLALGIFLLFIVLIYPRCFILDLDPSVPIGADANYYIRDLALEEIPKSHFFSLLISTRLTGVSGGYKGVTLALFHTVVLFSGIYYLVRRINHSWAISLILPFSVLIRVGVLGTALYAQMLSLSLFIFFLGLFIEKRRKMACVPLTLALISHAWTGIILYGCLILYILIFEDLKKNLILLLPVIPPLLLMGPEVIKQCVEGGITGGKSLKYNAIYLSSTNLGLILFGIIGARRWRRKIHPELGRFIFVQLLVVSVLTLIFFMRGWRLWLLNPIIILAVYGMKDAIDRKQNLLLVAGVLLMIGSRVVLKTLLQIPVYRFLKLGVLVFSLVLIHGYLFVNLGVLEEHIPQDLPE